MRLTRIEVHDVPPIRCFEVGALSNIVVFAGPNGVGKTRLLKAILGHLQGPKNETNVRVFMEATTPEELSDWGKRELDTSDRGDAVKLGASLQKTRRRRRWRSSVISFESDRSIQKITPFVYLWDVEDPEEESLAWNMTFGGLKARFSDTLHSIFRAVQSHRDRIAKRAEELKRQGHASMQLDFADPLESFKRAFSQLLAPKELVGVDPTNQQLLYRQDGQRFPVTNLSSGEQEVVNIVFDFLLRRPAHSIITFDEPELHLHPELSFKLLRALEAAGEQNQFIFCTHSPDIITASLENSVVFIAPPNESGSNQAIPVSEDDETNQALRRLGQSIGVIALGRRIVLVEGTYASLDRQVYGAIIRNKFPNLVLVPAGGKATINSFATLSADVLDKALWGVDFFMLCDGDSSPSTVTPGASNSRPTERVRILPRYHLENYFLDEHILARVFSEMEPADSWLRSPERIAQRLREIAGNMLSYAVALQVSALFRQQSRNVDLMPPDCHSISMEQLQTRMVAQAGEEHCRLSKSVREDAIKERIRERFEMLEGSLQAGDGAWKGVIPGRPILHTFAAESKLGVGRLKTMFLREAEREDFAVFKDALDIFEHFSSFTP